MSISRRAALVGTLATVLAAVPLACEKGGGGTDVPGSSGGAPTGKGVSLRYGDEARTLKSKTSFEMTQSGAGQFGEFSVALGGALDLGAGAAEKVKIGWKVESIDQLELKGAMKPKGPVDIKAILLEQGAGAFVIDGRGEIDDDATKELAENKARRARMEAITKQLQEQRDAGKDPDQALAAEAQVLGLLAAVMSVPSLPEPSLEVGKPVKVEDQEETALGGIVIPTERETTYTLVKIDESGGARIAEVSIEDEASGATETPQGMLVVDSSVEGSLLFNLDDQIPVAYDITSTQSISQGEMGFELTTIIKATYE